VTFLGGIPIRKTAVGGWVGAAVSEDNDLYIWGGQAGDRNRVSALPSPADDEEVKLVDINGGVDVIDVGVGSGHVVALTADGEVWVAGEGEYGQLGTGGQDFEEDWVRVRGDWEGKGKVVAVGAGVWCSWIMVDTRKQT
jgi:alpha-tubulin suppressor-like RCC1 family protein